MKTRRTFGLKVVSLGGFAIVLGLSFVRVHLRMQTTLLGYELGELKSRESSLLEARDARRVELAKLTAKSTLLMLSNEQKPTKSIGAYAYK